MDPLFDSTSTATTTPSGVPLVGYDLLTPLLRLFFGDGSSLTDVSASSVFSFISALWSTYAVVAYVVSALLLYFFIYASIRKEQLDQLQQELTRKREEMFDEQFRTGPKNDRLADVLTHIDSDNPNDWKLAIIEADIILDEALKRAGYNGASLGERLRSLTPMQLRSLDDAWQAHKVRNQIAHGGIDFVLTKRLAEDTVKQYQRVFAELGIS